MNIHIAVFKWQPGVTDQKVRNALRIVKSLEALVPGVQAIFVGENSSRWSQGYTHAVVVVGDSADAIQAYRDHPVHVDVAAEIEEMELDGVGVDFADDGL